MSGRRILLVPAMASGPEDHWYPDLVARLDDAGVSTVVVTPPVGEAHLVPWLASIDAATDAAAYDAVVGHSLGAVAALAWLTTRMQTTDRFIGFGSFDEPLPDLPTTAEFTAAVDADVVRNTVRHRILAVSENDYAVPPAMTEHAAASIGAELIRYPDAGHFLARDGWTDAASILHLLGIDTVEHRTAA